MFVSASFHFVDFVYSGSRRTPRRLGRLPCRYPPPRQKIPPLHHHHRRSLWRVSNILNRLVPRCHHLALPVPDFKPARVEIFDLARGWRAGQHVQLRVLSREMGWMSSGEVHSFTIASVKSNLKEEGVVLLAKSRVMDDPWRPSRWGLAESSPHPDERSLGHPGRPFDNGNFSRCRRFRG